ncbi:MAG: DUF6046 domain-containing protein [Paludibacter sp.]|nr:DUF6046 domain-containing protein [Paludibacter sp.]
MGNDYKILGIDSALNMLVQLFGRPYVIPGDEKTDNVIGAYNVSVKQEDEYDRLSQFGTPVFGLFKAKGGDYDVFDNNSGSRIVKREYADFEFPVATIVDFSRKKSTVVTPTLGGKGSVKEIMGLDDWRITIRGLIINDESRVNFQRTVKQQQYRIDMLNEIVGSIAVEGKIFEQRNIHHITLLEVRYTPVQGKPGLVQYEIDALSDEDFFI